MAEKLNISFRIRAVDDFTATMKSAQAQLESLKDSANSRMSAFIAVHLLSESAEDELDRIRDKVDRFGNGADINVDFRTDGYEQVMGKFAQFKQERPGSKTVTTTFKVKDDMEKALSKLSKSVKAFEDKTIVTTFENSGLWDAIEEFQFFKEERPNNKTITTRFTTRKKDAKDLKTLQDALDGLVKSADDFGNVDVSIGGLDTLTDINREMKDFNRNVKDTRKTLKNPIKPNVDNSGLDKGVGIVDLFRQSWQKLKGEVATLANLFRSFGEIFQHSVISGFLSLAPIAVPAIASVGGALGALLPIIGVMGGGIMGMATSFGLAGAGAVAFGSLAVSALGGIFETSKKIADLNKQLANTTDEKERIKILHEISHAQDGLNAKQKEGLTALQSLKGEWSGISSALAPQVIDTFVIAMGGLQTLLQEIAPMFSSVSTHAQNLVKWLNAQIETEDMQAFFDMLNVSAGPSMERMGKALSNFLIGIGNLMTAFAPLSVSFEQGFLKMSESFRAWTASLAGSEKFNAFIDYVKENGPKILTILGNIVGGLVGMGIAFAPFAEDMLTGLVDLTQRFQDWGNELKNNKGFQDFIEYVRTNGPMFLSFLGQFVTFLINLGIAFAPIGQWLLKTVTGLVKLANEWMTNNREVSKVIAVIVWLTSVFSFLVPVILFVKNGVQFLIGVIKIASKVIKPLIAGFTKFTGWLRIAIPWIGRAVLAIGRFLGPIGLVVTAVITLGLIIYKNWDKIKKWSTEMVEAVVRKFGELVGKWNSTMDDIKSAFDIIKKIDLYESGKKIIGSLINGVLAKVGAIGSAISKVVGPGLRDYLPFSPAKKGPLSDLDKLNFGGPIIDSIRSDGPRIAKAMNAMLQAPEFSASNSVYSARSAGYRSQEAQTASMKEAMAEITIESAGVFMDQREVGRATFKATTRNQERDGSRRDKFKGGSATA